MRAMGCSGRHLLLLLALVSATLFTGCALHDRPAAAQPPADNLVRIDILQLNDVYEIAAVEGGHAGGLARVATIRKRLLQETPNTFVLHAGDFASPSALGTVKIDGERLAGRQMVAVMNAAGVDLVTPGNHEFDLKEGQFLSRVDESRFSWTSANVFDVNGKAFPKFTSHQVLNAVGPAGQVVRIGVIGATMPGNHPSWVKYDAPLDAFRREAQALSGKVDILLGLTHLPLADDIRLATGVPAIDLVIGGHEHENIEILRGRDLTPVTKADANARTVYVHRLTWNTDTHKLLVRSGLVVLDDSIPEDADVLVVVNDWLTRGFNGLRAQGFDPGALVANVPVALDGLEASVRNHGTTLTELVARAWFNAVPAAELALFNGGAIRVDDEIPPGPVTQYDVIRMLPFEDEVVGVDIRGSLLLRLLDQGAASVGTGAYLHGAGVAREGNAWLVQGKPVDPRRNYRLATSRFLVSGAEQGMDFLRPGPDLVVTEEAGDARQALIEELRRTYSHPGP